MILARVRALTTSSLGMFSQYFLHGSLFCFDSLLFKVNLLVLFFKLLFSQLRSLILLSVLLVLLVTKLEILSLINNRLKLCLVCRLLLIFNQNEFALHHHVVLQGHWSLICVLHVHLLLLGSTDPVSKL